MIACGNRRKQGPLLATSKISVGTTSLFCLFCFLALKINQKHCRFHLYGPLLCFGSPKAETQTFLLPESLNTPKPCMIQQQMCHYKYCFVLVIVQHCSVLFLSSTAASVVASVQNSLVQNQENVFISRRQ